MSEECTDMIGAVRWLEARRANVHFGVEGGKVRVVLFDDDGHARIKHEVLDRDLLRAVHELKIQLASSA